MTMLDFTSVLYLGMHHPHEGLRPWRQLTTGRPAALGSSERAEVTAQALAQFLRCEMAALGTSTLHLFWDLFGVLAAEGITIHVDAGTYPIARWGVERVKANGVFATSFRRHDPASLRTSVGLAGRSRLRPVVVTDGLCPLTGQPAPLFDYARIVRDFGGLLVIDDTQAFGILGKDPSHAEPYGVDGAGTPAWFDLSGPDLIIVSSLAKGFGAPLALIAGSQLIIEKFKTMSLTRVHCSPPSLASISAGEDALAINAAQGMARRRRLIELVRLFQAGLRTIGLSARGSLFPFQTPGRISGARAVSLHNALLGTGVRTVLHGARIGSEALVSFAINALHTPAEIARAFGALRECCGRTLEDGMAQLAS